MFKPRRNPQKWHFLVKLAKIVKNQGIIVGYKLSWNRIPKIDTKRWHKFTQIVTLVTFGSFCVISGLFCVTFVLLLGHLGHSPVTFCHLWVMEGHLSVILDHFMSLFDHFSSLLDHFLSLLGHWGSFLSHFGSFCVTFRSF